jgi:membrane-bound lytic murein transglycosylase B
MMLRRSVPAGALVLALLAAGACSRLPDLNGTRIPEIAFEAYRSAAAAAPSVDAGCAVDWEVVAGIGRVESNHGRSGARREIAADGVVTPPIRGLPLNGGGGRMAIPDTDGGELDGDPAWDRAMGPLQFIPTTWRQLGRDGNGDGVADPDNLYDAALTAVAHLCLREPGDYADRAQLRGALVDYNASGAYADEVLGWIDRYRETPVEELILTVSSAAPAGPGGG